MRTSFCSGRWKRRGLLRKLKRPCGKSASYVIFRADKAPTPLPLETLMSCYAGTEWCDQWVKDKKCDLPVCEEHKTLCEGLLEAWGLKW